MKVDYKYPYMRQWRAALPAIAALGAVLLWSAADRELARARAEYAAMVGEHAALSERVARMAKDERAIQDYLPTYLDLQARGVLGEERRRDWIDAMSRFKTARGLYDAKYAIEPRRVLAMLPQAAAADIELRASRMELDLQLLHEGDLLGFLADLQGMAGAQLLPRDCVIRRLEASVADRGTEGKPGPQLHAHCSFDLATIAERRRREER